MTWRQAKEAALLATLLAVLVMLFAHVQYYLRHLPPS
jgi:hypothetical protein